MRRLALVVLCAATLAFGAIDSTVARATPAHDAAATKAAATAAKSRAKQRRAISQRACSKRRRSTAAKGHASKRRSARKVTRPRRRCVRKRRKIQAPRPDTRTPAAPSTPAPGGPSGAAAAPDPHGSDAGAAETGPPLELPALPSSGRAVQVLAGEFFLNLSRPTVRPGSVRVEFNNAFAEDPHDLHLFRADGTGGAYAFGELGAGEVQARSLDLSPGTWQLLCSLPQHASRGMTARLTVSDS